MNKLIANLLLIVAFAAVSACGKQEPSPEPAGPATPAEQSAPAPAEQAPASTPATAEEATAAAQSSEESTPSVPAETVSETDDAADAPAQTSSTGSTAQPSLRVGTQPSGAPTSGRFKEGTHYRKLVPAQPTGVAPGKVEVVEVFWYGCGHCYALDPTIESWRGKTKASYIDFVRVPAMWNEGTRMHARLFYTIELLGKGDTLHSAIFREIHVNRNPLTSVDSITAFMKQQGVNPDEFNKAFSSFAVESKLQRADFLNRRYRIESVPTFVVNGKYVTDVGDAGGEPGLFALIDELAASERGG